MACFVCPTIQKWPFSKAVSKTTSFSRINYKQSDQWVYDRGFLRDTFIFLKILSKLNSQFFQTFDLKKLKQQSNWVNLKAI